MDPLRIRAETKGFFTRAEARDTGYDDKAVALSDPNRRVAQIPPRLLHLHRPVDGSGRRRAAPGPQSRRTALAWTLGCVEPHLRVPSSMASRRGASRWIGCTSPDWTAAPAGWRATWCITRASCLDDDVVEVNGHRVLVPERCAIEAASRVGNEVALVLFDSLLHHELATYDELQARFELMQFWPRTRHLHIPVRMADGAAESPGESRGRWLCWMAGLPLPQLQYRVFDASGVLIARCDWAWPDHGTLGEFDGRVKYGRALLPGQDPGEVVFAEKQREDLDPRDHRMSDGPGDLERLRTAKGDRCAHRTPTEAVG